MPVVIPLFCAVVPNNERIFRKVFDEALGCLAVDEEVESLGDGAQPEEREEGSHDDVRRVVGHGGDVRWSIENC